MIIHLHEWMNDYSTLWQYHMRYTLYDFAIAVQWSNVIFILILYFLKFVFGIFGKCALAFLHDRNVLFILYVALRLGKNIFIWLSILCELSSDSKWMKYSVQGYISTMQTTCISEILNDFQIDAKAAIVSSKYEQFRPANK